MKSTVVHHADDLTAKKFAGRASQAISSREARRPRRRWLAVIAAVAAMAGLAPRQAEAAYEGSGTFNLITSTSEITPGGYYVFVARSSAAAMGTSFIGSGLTTVGVTVGASTGTVITDPPAHIVWRIDSISGGYNIYSEANSRYLLHKGSAVNGVTIGTANTATAYKWTFATTLTGRFQFPNVEYSSRILQFNAGSPRFACYAAGQTPFRLFKMAAANQAPVATAQTVSPNEDVDYTITLAGTDADSDPLTAIISALPAAGKLYQTADGTTRGAEITSVPTTVSDSSKRVIYISAVNGNGAGHGNFGFKVNDGTVDSSQATVTVNVTAVSDAPVISVAPSISGTTTEGQTLTATSGTWTRPANPSGTITYSYQWYRDDDTSAGGETAIGSDQNTYVLVGADVGKYIKVVVTATENSESGTPSSSAYTAQIASAGTPAAITTQPDETYAGCAGSSVNLTVSASGTPSYAWRKRDAGWGSSWSITAGGGGVFIGSSANNSGGGSGDINTSGQSWGMYNSSGGTTEAVRDFAGMAVGDVFYVEMDNGWINSGKTVGFSLRNSSGDNLVEFYFTGGDSEYRINRSGGAQGSGIAFTGGGLLITLTNTSSTTYSMMVQVKGGSLYGPFTGTYINSGPISRFRAFNYDAGSGSNYDVFFNNLKVGPFLTCPFYEDTAAAYSAWSGDLGTGPLANGGDIAGATSDTLTISNLESADNGTYDVVVYNGYGGVVSSSARGVLTVNVSPTITLGASPTVYRGTTSANLPYTGTSGTPNQYAINFDATAEAAGFSDVSWTALGASPIAVTVPAGAAAATYNGTITVRISGTGCESAAGAFTVTVSAINNPSGQSATRDAVNVTSEIDLAWSKNAQSHDVIVVRKTSAQSWTEPTQGTTYNVSDSIGAGVVVYKGSATSYSNTGLTPGTTYDYKFYSINNNYYSAGVTAQASTLAVPTLTTPTATSIGQTAATLGATVTADGGASLSSRGTYWGTTTDPLGNGAAEGGTAVSAFSHERTGLSQGTKYFYRGYAVNAAGTGYSASGSFHTEPGQASSVQFSDVIGTTMTISWTAGADSDGSIVVIRAGNSTVSDPTDGTLHNANAAFGSGADLGSGSYVVYAGAAETVDVTGLTGGTTYYVEVFAYKGTVATSGADQGINYRQTSPATGNEATCTTPSAPTVSEESGVTSSGFTANWEAVSGATGYRLDVSEYASFSTGGGSDYTVDFEGTGETKAAYASGTVSLSGVNWDMTEAVIGTTAGSDWFNGARSARMRGYAASSMTMLANLTTGIGYVKFNYRRYATDAQVDWRVEYSTNDGTSWTQIGSDFTAPANDTVQVFSNAVNVSGNVRIRIKRATETGSSNNRLNIDDITIAPSGSPSFVSGWENVNVGNVLTYPVTGLDPSSTYYYRVRAVNACGTSANSDAEEVTTSAGTPSIALADNGTQIGAGNVAAGTASHVLHKFMVTVTVAAAELNELAIGTAGSYVSGDLTNLKLWYSTDATFGGDATIGTLTTPGTAGTKTFTGLTQALPLGDHYFFVTADIASGAAAGNTLSVGAIANTALTYASGNKTGGPTTAGGTQTIITLPTVTSPTATSIGQTTATLGANVTSLGGTTISARGTVWGVSANPTGNVEPEGGTTTGVFTEGRTGFSQGTKIYYRGYAVNSVGTAYSEDGSFHTEPGQASGVSFSAVTGTGMTISWTDGADSDGAIVVVRAGNSTVSDPTDGALHSANAAFGSGADLGSGSHVVYRGAAETVDVTGLTAGTTYYVEVFAYKGTVADSGVDQGINYRQTSPAANSQTTPTVPILTTPTATGIGQTAATLGATITANGGAALSSRGTVYNTTGSPVTENGAAEGGTDVEAFTDERTGLSQGTRYFYRGYAVNAVGTGYSPQGSFHTEPGQAADVTFANVTATGMRISWTAGDDSDGAIVVVRAASAVVDGPTDGTTHSASTTFASGANLGNSSYVVFRGAGTQVDVTGLTAGTTYHVAVHAFKGTAADSGNDLGINYRQTSPATGNKPTLAAEPTTHSSSLSFSNIGPYQMDLSWTGGNGASRIVVVREGAATTWTPTDGTAPSGVSAVFSSAGDQDLDENRICYDGSGSGFTLSGLLPETTYHVTIFEYNGSGTEVNYYTGGTPLSGNETTAEETCTPNQVVLIQQTNYYWDIWSSQGGTFNNGGTEVGQWAHDDNTGLPRQTVAWRAFNTSGNGSGDARALEPGDRFRISVHGYSPSGILGMSLNDGASTGSWANRHSNTRGYIEAGNGNGDLYVTDAGGALSWSGIRPWNTTLTMEFHILSSREFTANIVGQPPIYDRSMIGAPGDTDRIDGFSIYYHDDWADSARRDAFWKQDTTITNLGYVEFGADNNASPRTIAGKITDGTNPKCPETPSPNFLKKSGSGTITLGNANNTYSLYTEIAGGTLNIAEDGMLGAAPATPQAAHLRFSAAGAALVGTDSMTLNANRGITLSNWAYLAVADTKVLNYNGVITDGAGSYSLVKNQGGELVLGGENTYDGGTYIDHGTLTLNDADAAGTGGIFVGRDSGTEAATLKLGLATTFANNLTIRTESSGIKYLAATETATLSGTLAINETDDDRFTIDVAGTKTLTVGGTVSGDSDGGKITKTGDGTLVFSGTNTHDKKLQINAGTVSLSASRNLGADPGGVYTNKILLNGGTLSADATFTLNSNYGIALYPNNGFLAVTDGYTLTYGGAITGTGGMGKTGTGTLLLTGANTFAGALTNSAGTVQIGNNGTSGSVSANIVNNAALVWHRSDSVTYSAAISGTGTLTKNGAGTLTLSGANGMSGNTTVAAGTLLVSGSLASSAVSVSSGATLMGDGPVGALTVTGTVDPGNSAAARATLVCGALTLNDGGAMRVDMSAAAGTAGTEWDLISSSGAIAANASGTFTINLYGTPTGFNAASSYSWKIMGGTSVTDFSAGRFAVDTNNFLSATSGGSFAVDQDGNDIVLTFTPGVPDAPAALTATATGPDTIQLTFTLNANSSPVVIVYDLDNTFSDPSGSVPAVGQAFAGGTVVYAGSTSPQNHTGLDACETYYYKAWSYNGTVYSATGLTANDETDPPDAPVVLEATNIGSDSFTANWEASDGAVEYRLDVMTSLGGGGGGPEGSIYTVDFEDGSSKSGYAPGNVTLNGISWNLSEALVGNTASDRRNGTYSVRVRSNETVNSTGIVSMNADTNMGLSSITLLYAKYGGDANTAGRVEYSTNSGTSWISAGTFDVTTTDLTLFTATNINVTGNVRVRVVKTSGTTARYNIDDINLYPYSGGGGSPTYVTNYEDLDVGDVTSYLVEDLDPETTYWYVVRALGVGACASDDSEPEEVVTLPPPATVVLANNGTQVAAANVAQGAAAHVLHKFQLTVSDANATLTGVSFTTAGTYDAADIDNFRVWYSADNSFDSGADTSLGAISSSLGTGSHSLSSLSQAVNIGVGYFFITADFDAAATIGNTINVAAVATNDLTFTTATISGSTTAGGAQTIISGIPSYTMRYTGFEGTTADNWSWTSTGNAELGPRTDAITGKTGDYSLMLRGSQSGNEDPTILFDNVTIPDNAEDIELSIGYAAVGPDANDDLFVDVSYDNGATWTVQQQLVDGFNNYNLNFGATDIADRTPTLANPYVLSIPDDTAQVRVRIRYDEATGNDNRFDRYFIDEVKLVAGLNLPTVSFATARTVTNESDTTQFNIPVTISQASDATVRVAIAGTALPGGVDFTAASTTLVFTAGGGTTQNLQITINNDTIAEGVETVRFTLTLPEGVKIVGPDVHTLFIRDDDAFTIATANLVSGTTTVGGSTAYDDPGQRLLKALLPDIVAIQEWVVTNSVAAFVEDNFGAEYDYYIEPEGDANPIPNGIISRWPILAEGQWLDYDVGSRDFVWATIDLPGAKNLNLVNVHLKAGNTPTDVAEREAQTRALTNYIANAGFDAGDYLAIAGDLNQSNRTDEAVLTILGNLVSDAKQPTTKSGSKNTNPSDSRPYDFVLPDAALEVQHVGMSYNGTSFPDGFIFDSREWGDHQYPALGSDSEALNLTHRPVLKVFTLAEIVAPPASLTATAASETQIDLAFQTNAAGNTIVIVFNTTGSFTTPSGAPPSVNDAFAGGTAIYVGTGSSFSHTGRLACTEYFYRAWSVTGSDVWSTGIDDSAMTDAPSVPTGLYANPTNGTSFGANWTAVSGATGYRIDVSESETFTGTGGESALTLLASNGATTASITEDGWGGAGLSGSTYVTLLTSSSVVTSPAFSTVGFTNLTVDFRARTFGGASGTSSNVTVSISTNNGADWTVMGVVWPWNTTMNAMPTLTNTADLGFSQTRIRWQTLGADGSRGVGLTNLVVQGWSSGAGSPSYVPGFENLYVAGTNVSVTGLEEDTAYFYRVAAEGGTCTSDYSTVAGVTTRVTSVSAPTGFSATPVSATQIDVAFTPNGATDPVVIVWNLTGTFDAPSGAPATVGNAFAGGTVLYNGTTSPQSHTGLDACTEYFYRAWSYNSLSDTPYSAAVSDSAETPAPAAPALVYASDTNYTDFVAEWTPSAGATGYYIDVSESPTFSASGGDGTRMVLASNAATSAGSITNEWSGFQLAGTTYVLMTNSASVVTSPAFSTVGFTNLTVDFRARSFGTVAGTTRTNITVSISTDNGASWTVMGVVAPANNTLNAMPTLTNTADLGHAETRIRWQTLTAGAAAGVGVDRLVVQGWEASGGSGAFVDGYENLYVADTNVTVSGLAELATYYFRVRATAGVGCTSGNSETGEVTTLTGSPYPPSTLDASDGTYLDRVALLWNNVADETGYTVFRNTLNLPAGATVIGQTAADTTWFDDTTATPGQIYYYWVSASNAIGSSAKSTVDTGYRRLAAPTDVAATDGTSLDNVGVTWTASSGATSYKIFRDTDSDPAGAADLGTQNSGYLDTTAVPGQLYHYWVMAAASSSSSTSSWSAADTGFRKLATVPGLTASYDLHNDRIELDWTDVTGETGYGIWRNTVNDSATATFLGTAAANDTGYDDYTGSGGVEYFYWVTATNTTSSSMGDFQVNGELGRMLDPTLPIVITEDPTAITSGGANGGGNVINEGTTEVTERGVVWSTNQNPTTVDGIDTHADGGPGFYTNYISGLVAGQTYYVRAYAVNGGGTVYGAQKTFQTPCFSTVVNGLHVNPTNGLDFTARWAAMPGATGYRLDVSTNQYFLEGSSVAEVISESFAGFVNLNGSTDRSGTLDSYLETPGWTGVAVYENAGEAKMGASSTAGILNSPALNLSANGGQAVLTFDARKFGTDFATIYVGVSHDGVNYIQSGDTIVLTNDMMTYTNFITNGTASCRVRIAATHASSKRFYLDNWRIEQGSGEPSFLPGYSNLYVAGTSQLVDGLETNSWYYFRVRAEGIGSCVSGDSATQPIQTRDLSPQGPDNVRASDGLFTDKVEITWNVVPVASNYLIFRNDTLDEFETATEIAELGVGATNYSDTTAVAGQGYWYFVVASNEYGWAESLGDPGWRGMATVEDVSASDGAYTDRVAVTWTDLNGGETGYAIFRSETASTNDAVCVGAADTDDEAYDDVDAIPGQQYWYWVRATNSTSEGLGEWGDNDPGYRKLAVVADLAASYNTYDDRIRITWTDSEGETGYTLWRNTVDNSGTATKVDDLSPNTASFDDYDATTGTPYYYWLRATNDSSGTQSDFQASGALGRRAQTPPVVTTLAISNNILGSARGGGDVLDAGGSAITNRGVVWNMTGDPSILDSRTIDGPGAGLGTYASTIAPTVGGETYYVRAYAQNGERIAYGNVVTFIAECMEDLPVTLAASDISSTTFVANWSAVAGAGSYRLDVSTNATFLGGYDANVAAYHNGTLGEGTGGAWLETNILQSAGYIALRTNAAALVTPAIDFDAGSGETLTFRARIFGGGGNGDFRNRVTVSISTDNGTTWTNVGTRTPMNTTLTAMEPINLSAYNGTQVKVRLQTLQASLGVGAGVVDVAVTNLLDPRGVFIGGYSNRTVGGTSQMVTNLLPETTYYYRVRAYASALCTSGNSDVRAVETMAFESTWDGEAVADRSNWNNPTNWVGDVLPQTNATVYFYQSAGLLTTNVDLNGNQVVKALRFRDDAAGNVALRGSTLTVFSGGIGVAAGAAGSHAILSDLTVAANQGWTNASARDFTIAGAVAGAGAIDKYGEGRIVLTSHDSTYTGGLTIREGALQIRGTNALGTTSAGTTVADGATLELHGGGNAVDYATEPLTIAGSGVSGGGALRFVQNNVDYKGPITLAGDARIQAASNSPVASGSIAIGANTLAVGVQAEATELRLGGALSGTRDADGEYAFVKDGPSRLILTGNNLNLTGRFHFQAGEIRIGSANAMGQIGLLVFGNNTVMKSSSVADYDISRPVLLQGNVALGEITTRTGTLRFGGDIDLGGATRTIAVSNPVTKWVEFAGNLSNGNLTKAGPGLLILSGDTADGVGLAVNMGTLQGTTHNLKGDIANNGLVVFWQNDDGTYAGNMSGTGSIEKNAANRLTLTGTSTHSGITMINEGTVVMDGTAARSAYVVGTSGRLTGSGTVGDLLIGGRVAPGSSPGTLTASNVVLSGGGVYEFEIANVAGTTPGVDWDVIAASGGVTVNATEADPFRVEVSGNAPGFDPTAPFSWKLVDSDLPVTGYSPRKFSVTHANFTNENMVGGSFMVGLDGDGDLAIMFQIPGISVRGTNGVEIAMGDATPDPVDGTDFGLQSVNATFHQTFSITNTGLAPVEISPVAVASASGFFAVTNQPPSLLGSGGVGTFTIAYSPTTTGTNTATVYVTNNVDGMSPWTFAIRAVAGIGAPSNLVVEANLHEMVKIDWIKSASDVVLLHRNGADLTGGPVNGVEYAVGDSLGGGTVIYKGGATNLDHQVAQNTTNFYAIYSWAGTGGDSVYSMGVTTWEAYTPIVPPQHDPGTVLADQRLRSERVQPRPRLERRLERRRRIGDRFVSGVGSLKPSLGYPPVGGNLAQTT
jgi:autotransporter-associated beta strand protein